MRSQPSQLRLWFHYSIVYGLVLPWVPERFGVHLYTASRGWAYGSHPCELTELVELAERSRARHPG